MYTAHSESVSLLPTYSHSHCYIILKPCVAAALSGALYTRWSEIFGLLLTATAQTFVFYEFGVRTRCYCITFTLFLCEFLPVVVTLLGHQQQQRLCISIRWISRCNSLLKAHLKSCIFVLCRLVQPSHHSPSSPIIYPAVFSVSGVSRGSGEETTLMFNQALPFKVLRCGISRGRRLL